MLLFSIRLLQRSSTWAICSVFWRKSIAREFLARCKTCFKKFSTVRWFTLFQVRLKELKKIKEQTPFLDFKNQLISNTMIFKENLKIIMNSLVEIMWRDKVKSSNIQETIQNAFQHIYKGGFDEIKEEEEENWITSRIETSEFRLSNARNQKSTKKSDSQN